MIQKHSVNAIDILLANFVPKRQRLIALDVKDNAFSQAIVSVYIESLEERPTIYFICLRNQMLPKNKQLQKFKNPRSFSQHFINKHIKLFLNGIQYKYTVYRKQLESKSALLNHTQGIHRIVSCLPLLVLSLPLP